MANYKQVSAFCSHCQRPVVANKEEINHTFWLIASLFSCGLSAIIWILMMLVHNPPARCSICGMVISDRPLRTSGKQQPALERAVFQPANSREATGKGLPPLGQAALVVGGVLFGLPVLFGFARILMQPSSGRGETVQTNSQSVNSAAFVSPSPVQKSAKEWIDESVKAGQILYEDKEGNKRPFVSECAATLGAGAQGWQFSVINDSRIPLRLRIITFERCIELEGRPIQAYREMQSRLDKYRTDE